MKQNEERVVLTLKRLGLSQCPDCQTPFTVENVGWNTTPDFTDVFPIVYVACKVCKKRVRDFQVTSFAQSLDEAIEALENSSGVTAMSSKSEKGYLEDLCRDGEKSVTLFSSRGQKELEKCATRGFLRALGIAFLEEELHSGQAEPIDVCFRDARFQVTERLDLGRRRNLEVKEDAERRRNATSLEQLVEPFTPSRPMDPARALKLVLEAVTKKWERYRSSSEDVDVLVYINLQGRHLYPTSPWPDVTDFRDQGWRSVSVLFGCHAAVLFARTTAPDFLRSVVGQTRREWNQPDGMFDP